MISLFGMEPQLAPGEYREVAKRALSKIAATGRAKHMYEEKSERDAAVTALEGWKEVCEALSQYLIVYHRNPRAFVMS